MVSSAISSMPLLRTTVVGSYPVPDWLAACPSRQALIDATRVVFKTQEMAGIDVVADGELYRFDVNHPDANGTIDYFIGPMSGIRSRIARRDIADFAQQEGMSFRAEPAGVVDGPIDEGTLNLLRDYRRARSLTAHPLKFTLSGPHMLSKTLLDRHYPDRAELAMALGAALAKQVAELDPDVLQVDEANLPGYPDEAQWAAAAINQILDAASLAREKGVHLCLANYGGQAFDKEKWSKLIHYLNALHADHVLLEFAFRGDDELAYFKESLDPRIALGLGVIDVKVNTVETPGEVARRIEAASKILGPGRIKWVHPDCGLRMNQRSIADRKMAALVQGRNLFLGQ